MKLRDLPVLGWREWVALPELGVDKIRCKVDSGARTSALHAFYVEEFPQDAITMVRFGLHPEQDNTDKEIHCEAKVLEKRDVTDSGGHTESRYVIETQIVLGNTIWSIEVNLTNRDTMLYRMLLGRTAIADNYLVDSGGSHLAGEPGKEPISQPILSRLHDEEEE